MSNPERLNKVLARLGYGSRRNVDGFIESGRVTINGTIASLGQKIMPQDTIALDGKIVTLKPFEPIIIAFNKPQGVTTTKSDPYAKVTVMDYLPRHLQHLYPVGRLDKQSRGLLLLTNDGDLALKLLHPRYGHEKEYSVTFEAVKKKTQHDFNQDQLRLSQEIIDPQIQTQPVKLINPLFFVKEQRGKVTIILNEGKKRQIRELFSRLGYFVTDLKRTRMGRITLEDMKEGEYRRVDSKDLV